jgi:hypothetical protein
MKLCFGGGNGTGDHHAEQDKPSLKSQISRFHSYVESRPNKMVIKIITTAIMGHKGK